MYFKELITDLSVNELQGRLEGNKQHKLEDGTEVVAEKINNDNYEISVMVKWLSMKIPVKYRIVLENNRVLLKEENTKSRMFMLIITIVGWLFLAIYGGKTLFDTMYFCKSLPSFRYVLIGVAILFAGITYYIYRAIYLKAATKKMSFYMNRVVFGHERAANENKSANTSDNGKKNKNEELSDNAVSDKKQEDSKVIKYYIEPRPNNSDELTFRKAVTTVGFFACVILIYYAIFQLANGASVARSLFIASACLFIIGILAIVNEGANIKLKNKVAGQLKQYDAEFGYAQGGKDNGTYMQYIFEDENGKKHRVRGFDPIEFSDYQMPLDVKGVKRKIWYDAELIEGVLVGEKEPYIKPIKQTLAFRNALTKIIVAVVLIAISVFINVIESPVDKVGKSMEIEWADKMTPTAYEQKDIQSDTVRWITNTYALRVRLDRGSYGAIGMYKKDENLNVDDVAQRLNDYWEITDRESAIKTINNMLEHGSRQEYKKYIFNIKRNKRIKGEELRYEGAHQAYNSFGDVGIEAWDYCNVMLIAGESYLAGYISFEECMNQCYPIAKHLQEDFNSWEELNNSYIYGYKFSAKSEINREFASSLETYSNMLQNRENGPYSLNYKTELMDNWTK